MPLFSMKFYGALLILILLQCTVLEASEKKVSLKEAVVYALDNNYELRALKNGLAAQGEDVSIARSYLLPKLVFEERFMRTNNPVYSFMSKLNQSRFGAADFEISSLNNPKAINDFQTSFVFEQPVFVKKAIIGFEMSKKELEARVEELKQKKEEIAMKVIEAYLGVNNAREFVEASKRSLEESREHVRTAQLRYKNNLGLYSDTLRAETALKEAEQRVVTSEKNLNVAKRALALLMGLDNLVETDDTKLALVVKDLDHYDSHGQLRHDLRSMNIKLQNAIKNIALAESDYYPIIGVGGSYQMNDHRKPFGSEGDSWQLMAFLRWNVFDGSKRGHERTKAKYQMQQIEEHYKGMKKFVSYKIYEAYQGYQESLKNLDIAKKAYESAKEGVRLVKLRYENALSPIVDLLAAQGSLDNARANLIYRENEVNRNLANLNYESGLLLKELAIE